MISGEFEIVRDKCEYEERTMNIELCIVTDESSGNNSDKFLEELQDLLNKYAI